MEEEGEKEETSKSKPIYIEETTQIIKVLCPICEEENEYDFENVWKWNKCKNNLCQLQIMIFEKCCEEKSYFANIQEALKKRRQNNLRWM